MADGWAGRWAGHRVRETVEKVLRVYGTMCHLCGLDGADSADHLVPRSRGGSNHLDNLRPAHKGCNIARGDRDLSEWFARHPPPAPDRPALRPSREW